jgi:hypothetical protein
MREGARSVGPAMIARASLAMVLLCASPARACWDGGEISTDRAWLVCTDCGGWSLEDAQLLATWAVRLEALIPARYRVSLEPYGELSVCHRHGARSCILREYAPVRFEEIFDRVARSVRAGPRARARAARRQASLAVVTIGSFASLERAERRAEWANDLLRAGGWPHPRGDYAADGGPSLGTAAHVASHGARHRVVAGVFLALDDARALARALSRAGIDAAVVRI